jgi:hypothetical protein
MASPIDGKADEIKMLIALITALLNGRDGQVATIALAEVLLTVIINTADDMPDARKGVDALIADMRMHFDSHYTSKRYSKEMH